MCQGGKVKDPIRVIVKRVGEEPCTAIMPNTLAAMQGCVNGYIEPVHLGYGLIMLVNEEGCLDKDCRFNCYVKDYPYRGTLLFLGEDGEDFGDVPCGIKYIKGMIRQ